VNAGFGVVEIWVFEFTFGFVDEIVVRYRIIESYGDRDQKFIENELLYEIDEKLRVP
jgi:hypothetical protein